MVATTGTPSSPIRRRARPWPRAKTPRPLRFRDDHFARKRVLAWSYWDGTIQAGSELSAREERPRLNIVERPAEARDDPHTLPDDAPRSLRPDRARCL